MLQPMRATLPETATRSTHDCPHPARHRSFRLVRRGLDYIFDRDRAVGKRPRQPQRSYECLSRRMDGASAGTRHAHGRRPGYRGAAEWHCILCIHKPDCYRWRAHPLALKRRNNDSHVHAAVRRNAIAALMGSENDGADCDFCLRILQVRLVQSVVQLFRHHDRRCSIARRARYAGGTGFCAPRGADMCRRRPPFQSRPARLLLRARYLGWFLGPVPFALSTAGILIVMWQRQFASEARQAFEPVEPTIATPPKDLALRPSPSRRRSPPRSAPRATPRER